MKYSFLYGSLFFEILASQGSRFVETFSTLGTLHLGVSESHNFDIISRVTCSRTTNVSKRRYAEFESVHLTRSSSLSSPEEDSSFIYFGAREAKGGKVRALGRRLVKLAQARTVPWSGGTRLIPFRIPPSGLLSAIYTFMLFAVHADGLPSRMRVTVPCLIFRCNKIPLEDGA